MRKNINERGSDELNYSDNSVDEYKPLKLEYLQQNPQEIVFELAPPEIIFSLLQGMENNPVLWKYHEEAYDEDYDRAIKYLCELMRVKWLLNIKPLQMCRSITRILRFYRFLFPFDIIEPFVDYFEKCARFLPLAVVEIPHARCFQCWRCFKRDRDLVSHMAVEHKNLKWLYKCLHCHERFANNIEFEFHKSLPHYLEIFTCQECNQKFDKLSSYNKHYPHQRPELPRRHVCYICQKGFKNKRILQLHEEIHKGKRFKCHLCPSAYYWKSKLNMHLMKHNQEQKKYICDVCGKGFYGSRELQKHMVVHTSLKITCNICNLQMRKVSLSRHLRTVHVVYEGTIESNFRAKGHRHKKSITYKEQPCRRKRKEEKGRNYECKICKIIYNRLKDLKTHNKEIHYDLIQKLPCKMCESILSQSGNLKRHYRVKHKLPEYQVFALVTKELDLKTALAITSPEELQKISVKK